MKRSTGEAIHSLKEKAKADSLLKVRELQLREKEQSNSALLLERQSQMQNDMFMFIQQQQDQQNMQQILQQQQVNRKFYMSNFILCCVTGFFMFPCTCYNF